MKLLIYLAVAMATATLAGCRKADVPLSTNVSVASYIEMLKADQYDSSSIPAFTYQDIPALLFYRNDKQLIAHFPRNPVSSFYSSKCKLGIYVLWTIESIRVVYLQRKDIVMGFPSQNSILAYKNADFGLVEDDASHECAANAYNIWWESNRRRDFMLFACSDPLEGTGYKWH
jgi:hypothetical protein